MQNVPFMKSLQTSGQLDQTVPNVSFSKSSLALPMLQNFAVKIASVSVLHNDAESGRIFVEKCLFVSNNVAVTTTESSARQNLLDAREDADLVESVLLFAI